MQAKINFLNTQISTVFTTESQKNAQLIKDNMMILNTAFKNIGFNNINIDVIQNTIYEPPIKPDNIQIVDEEA